MTSTDAHERIPAGSGDERVRASEPIEHVASETFGWIHPDVATQSITRRGLRPRHRHLVAVALWLAAVSLAVSWFGPWAAPVALIAVVLGAIALFVRVGRAGLAWVAIGAACLALLFSAYWVRWILEQLPVAS
ncbi:MAG: hypothetical protein ACTH2J_10180 [Candidatus Microbacterium stercoravium]|uniref:Uncharacterized protein n=1 Tax=Candidatus Microbacterium stercoravium TaxID=2838697 RepID=A0A9D2H3V3_9MICO|nr:hypothetical protein [Candidatus Microbacterium stercoravium]